MVKEVALNNIVFSPQRSEQAGESSGNLFGEYIDDSDTVQRCHQHVNNMDNRIERHVMETNVDGKEKEEKGRQELEMSEKEAKNTSSPTIPIHTSEKKDKKTRGHVSYIDKFKEDETETLLLHDSSNIENSYTCDGDKCDFDDLSIEPSLKGKSSFISHPSGQFEHSVHKESGIASEKGRGIRLSDLFNSEGEDDENTNRNKALSASESESISNDFTIYESDMEKQEEKMNSKRLLNWDKLKDEGDEEYGNDDDSEEEAKNFKNEKAGKEERICSDAENSKSNSRDKSSHDMKKAVNTRLSNLFNSDDEEPDNKHFLSTNKIINELYSDFNRDRGKDMDGDTDEDFPEIHSIMYTPATKSTKYPTGHLDELNRDRTEALLEASYMENVNSLGRCIVKNSDGISEINDDSSINEFSSNKSFSNDSFSDNSSIAEEEEENNYAKNVIRFDERNKKNDSERMLIEASEEEKEKKEEIELLRNRRRLISKRSLIEKNIMSGDMFTDEYVWNKARFPFILNVDKSHSAFYYENEQRYITEYRDKKKGCSSDDDNDDSDVLAKRQRQLLERRFELLTLVLAATQKASPTYGFFINSITSKAELSPAYTLPLSQFSKLMGHQREGISWMYTLHNSHLGMGGLLADDMGLGKTIQVIVFLSSLFQSESIKTSLLVMPKGLLENWTREFRRWSPEVRVRQFCHPEHDYSDLQRVQRRGGVILTTYGLVRLHTDALSNQNRHTWDYIILDEGHLIKNEKSQQYQAVNSLASHHKLLLTGTPIQNKLRELWTLFNFLCGERLLGCHAHFRGTFERPIEKAAGKDATPHEIKFGEKLAEKLRVIIKPFFMRREKTLLLEDGSRVENSRTKADIDEDVDNEDEERDNNVRVRTLGKKEEYVIWIPLSLTQVTLYRCFLNSPQVAHVFNESKSPLTALIVLKKICDHPHLIRKDTDQLRDIATNTLKLATEEVELMIEALTDPSIESLLKYSSKLNILQKLIFYLIDSDHRVLVFSQSVQMLDLVESIFKGSESHAKYLRLDGSISDIKERQQRVDLFNTDMKIKVFLLTTQVGGVGLALTSADRVIIFDPSWNPARDNQAVDRAYRVGQTSEVVKVYRFITVATVEEKIYRRQVFKNYAMNAATGGVTHKRYFTKDELKDLFALKDTFVCETAKLLEFEHEDNRQSQKICGDDEEERGKGESKEGRRKTISEYEKEMQIFVAQFGILTMTIHHWLYRGVKGKNTYDVVEEQYHKMVEDAVQSLQYATSHISKELSSFTNKTKKDLDPILIEDFQVNTIKTHLDKLHLQQTVAINGLRYSITDFLNDDMFKNWLKTHPNIIHAIKRGENIEIKQNVDNRYQVNSTGQSHQVYSLGDMTAPEGEAVADKKTQLVSNQDYLHQNRGPTGYPPTHDLFWHQLRMLESSNRLQDALTLLFSRLPIFEIQSIPNLPSEQKSSILRNYIFDDRIPFKILELAVRLDLVKI